MDSNLMSIGRLFLSGEGRRFSESLGGVDRDTDERSSGSVAGANSALSIWVSLYSGSVLGDCEATREIGGRLGGPVERGEVSKTLLCCESVDGRSARSVFGGDLEISWWYRVEEAPIGALLGGFVAGGIAVRLLFGLIPCK